MSPDIKELSVYDSELRLFEGQYVVPEGISYNSYLISDLDTTVLIDTVDRRKASEWQDNLVKALDGRQLNYLVVQHLEPDHSSQIAWVLDRYPDCKMIATATAIRMMPQLVDDRYTARATAVGDGDTIDTGRHQLHFFTTPMIHWPEVMMTVDTATGTLFSADGFGRFGNPDASLPWACEARRYYFNIVGKYGAQVQSALRKLQGNTITTIAPLHGPVLENDLTPYLSLYDTWSRYEVETPGIFIAYATMHGMTRQAALQLADMLKSRTGLKVSVSDLVNDDMAEAVEDAFRMSHLVVAAPTYDTEIFPPMHDFIHHLALKGYRNRTVGIIENGLWAPVAGRKMRQMFESMKNITIIDPIVTIHGRTDKDSQQALSNLADALLEQGQKAKN